jgi:ATP-dependent phosphofructokinase / diphosphate-dependent phosphofructokinase
VCLIPEIPYDINKVAAKLNQRIQHGKGFAIVVIAEGAKPVGGQVTGRVSNEVGYKNLLLGGVGHQLQAELKPLVDADSRVMILGHLQRGGSPVAFDRILATQFGQMVAYRHPNITSVSLKEAISEYNRVKLDSHLVQAARGVDMALGD